MTLAFETLLGRGTLTYDWRGALAIEVDSRRPATKGPHPAAMRKLAKDVARAVAGTPVSFAKAPLAFDGVPPFHADVYRALLRVPWGVTLSYGELAAKAGRPGAARAVGQAMARNRWSIAVAAHRVVASKGIGGFGGAKGVRLKRWLLDRELGVPSTRPPSREWLRASGGRGR